MIYCSPNNLIVQSVILPIFELKAFVFDVLHVKDRSSEHRNDEAKERNKEQYQHLVNVLVVIYYLYLYLHFFCSYICTMTDGKVVKVI